MSVEALPGSSYEEFHLVINFIDTFISVYEENTLKMWQDGPETVLHAMSNNHYIDRGNLDRALEIADYLILRLALNDPRLPKDSDISMLLAAKMMCLVLYADRLNTKIKGMSYYLFGSWINRNEIAKAKKLMTKVNEKFRENDKQIIEFIEAGTKFRELKDLSKSTDLDVQTVKDILDRYKKCEPASLDVPLVNLGIEVTSL
jgi:hypothetical protein